MFVCVYLDEFSELRRNFANVCVCVLRRITWIEKKFREKIIIFAKTNEISRMFVCVCLDEFRELRRIFAKNEISRMFVCVCVLRRI